MTRKRRTSVSFGSSEGGSKTMLFTQTSALVKATVTQLLNVPVGFFPPPLTLSKCNSCLTPTCLVFKKCPRHWCQASCQVILHQCLLCYRTGSCEVSSIVGRHNHSDSQSSGLGLFEMHALCILPGALLFKPHSTCDGTHRKSFFCLFVSTSDETVAASCYSERRWRIGGFVILK